MLREYLTNIANAIRAKLGTTDTINAQDFSTKVDEVYEQGRKDEYDEFWRKYLVSATYECSYKFSGLAWNSKTFRPPKGTLIRPEYAQRMFALFDFYNISPEDFDFVDFLKEQDVTLDFSKCISMQETFNGAHIRHLGVIDISASSTAHYGTFASDYIEKIDKLIVNEKKKYSSLFAGASGLKELTIEGTIGQNGFSVSSSKNLTKASITSIINALSQTTSGLTVTLSKTAVNNAFGINIDDPTTWAEGTEYYELRHSRDNWTITYV